MRWISHIAIAASLCAAVNPGAVPAAVLGSTFPDWLERVLRALTHRKVRHRGATHYLSTWLLLAAFAALLWDWQGWLLWFALGNVVHWFCDALTVSGAPVGWWSDRRITLFGGRVKTGSMAELAITVAIVALCAVVIYTRREVPGTFIPFFYRYDRLYRDGLIDGHEWKQHRFDFILAPKTHKTA
jgi:inner membrane protein